jgi:hypothetical protein
VQRRLAAPYMTFEMDLLQHQAGGERAHDRRESGPPRRYPEWREGNASKKEARSRMVRCVGAGALALDVPLARRVRAMTARTT